MRYKPWQSQLFPAIQEKEIHDKKWKKLKNALMKDTYQKLTGNKIVK